MTYTIDPCLFCDGLGYIEDDDPEDQDYATECPECDGTGYASDGGEAAASLLCSDETMGVDDE